MKIKYAEPIFVFLIIIVMLFNAVGLAVDAFSYDMEELPVGKCLYSELFPSDSKNLSLYLVELDGVNTAVRGEVSYFDENNQKVTRNVYWQVGEKTAIAGWKDENTVTINNKDIKINGEPYDSRTQIELPEYSAKNRTINN
ncbi:MAG: hypothetical protein E7551_09945 [Ruminococcaceae bacterium]|nr:hypothetical protein [Oscillospiraceae bacterium]